MPMLATRAGSFDRQITIQQKEITLDPLYGTEVINWVPLSYIPGSPQVAERYRAEVQDVLPSRDETYLNDLALARNATRIRIRWRSDVTSAMRVIVHGDTDAIYQIIGGPAEVGGRKQILEMLCEKYSS